MEDQEQVEQEQAEAEELAAMESVFGFEPDTPTKDDVTEVPDQEQPETKEETPDKGGEAEQPKYLTVAELQAALEAERAAHKAEMSKLHDRFFGRAGELQQKIDSIRAYSNISPKAKEKLSAEFPELAEMLFDNEPIPAQVPKQPEQPQIDVEEVVTKRLDETQKSFEKRLLKRDHPDWEQVINTAEFDSWKGTLPTPEFDKLNTSWDADYISGKLTEFKEWKAAQTAKQTQQQKKQDRFDAAITPTGLPRGATGGVSAEDEEEAALLSAFKKRN